MSEAELEIINFKNKEQFNMDRDRKDIMKRGGKELIDDNEISEEFRPVDEQALIGKMYRTIINEEI